MTDHSDKRPATPSHDATPWKLMLLLTAMTAVGPLSLNIVIPSVPSLTSALATNTGTAQLTVSLFLLALASAQLAVGPLADRFGRRPVFLAGFALAVVACAVGVVATSISQLVLARMAQAVGTATGVVIARAIIRDLFDRDRAAAMLGLVTTAMVTAPMIAPLIGGLLDTHIGWRAIFVVMGGCVLVVLAWAAVALPETRGAAVAGGQGFVANLTSLMTSAAFVGYALTAAFGTAGHYTFLGGGPHVVVTVLGYTSADYGLWFVAVAGGYMAGNFTVSRLTTRYGIHVMILWGLVIEAVGFVAGIFLALYASHLGLVMLFGPQIVASFGAGLMLPTALAGAIGARPQATATAAGFTGFLQMGLGAAVVQLAGFVVARATTAVPLAVTMTIMVALSALAFMLVRPRDLLERFRL